MGHHTQQHNTTAAAGASRSFDTSTPSIGGMACRRRKSYEVLNLWKLPNTTQTKTKTKTKLLQHNEDINPEQPMAESTPESMEATVEEETMEATMEPTRKTTMEPWWVFDEGFCKAETRILQ